MAGRAFLIIWPPSQFGDLPIPATFQQAALHAGAAGAPVLQVAGAAVSAVAAVPVAGPPRLFSVSRCSPCAAGAGGRQASVGTRPGAAGSGKSSLPETTNTPTVSGRR